MIKGAHGTCISNYEKILEFGFEPSLEGHRGRGVYFWGYSLDELREIVRELSIGWWAFAKNRGDYSKAKNTNCGVIYVNFGIDEDNDYLDVMSPKINDKFQVYYNKIIGRTKCTDEELSKIYDMFVNDLEEALKKEFKLIHTRIPAPKKAVRFAPIGITGSPSCYVARDASCVNIEKGEVIYE